jgi:hypothetical protein
MKNDSLNEKGFGNYANAIVLSKIAFNRLLFQYNYWYKQHKDGWFPVEWPSSLEGQIGEIQAKIAYVKISFIQENSKNVRLQFTLENGTFSYNNTKIAIDNWGFTTEGEVGFDVTKESTEDKFPYYKIAFDKIKENYREIHQFYINLKSQSLNGQIDYNNSELTQEQKNAFYNNVQLLIANYIAKHEKFVLLYLGTGIVPRSLSKGELIYFFPEAMYLHIFSDNETSEVTFPFRSDVTTTNWNGDINIPLVATGNEGSFILGRESFLSKLLNQPVEIESRGVFYLSYEEQEGKKKLKQIETTIKKDDYQNKFTIKLKDTNIINIKCEYNITQSFDLVISKTYKTTMVYHTNKEYEISLSLNYDNNVIETKIDDLSDKSASLDLQIDNDKKVPLKSKDMPCLFKAMVTGEIDLPGIFKELFQTKTSMNNNDDLIKELTDVLDTIIKKGNNANKEILNFTKYFDTNLNVPISTKFSFMELPESELVSFEKLHFDDDWNVCLDIKRKSSPSN